MILISNVGYQAYLLRVWRDESRGIWHASLQSTVTKDTHHFADVESLLHFLTVRQRPDTHDQSTDSKTDSNE